MHKNFTILAALVFGLILILLEEIKFIAEKTPLSNFVSVIAYSLVGTSVLFMAYKLIDWILPADIEAEIFDKQNVAAAIFKGFILLGIAIIISAVIVSP